MTCEETAVDAGLPDSTPIDALPSGCFGGFVTVCPDAPITGNTQLAINVPTTLNTTTSPQCMPYHLPDGTPDARFCVVGAKTIAIGQLGRWNVTGTRPLVVVATGQLDVAGTIDAASHIGGTSGPGADPAACVAGAVPAGDEGGPGGSFGTVGGAGGAVDLAASVAAGPPTLKPLDLRGGCPGSSGSGGNAGASGRGGGALYLIANELSITGTVNASGAGGRGAGLSAGGGGGGAGGMIVLDAATLTVANSARIFANGGGGGEGGGGSNGGDDGVDSTAPATAGLGGAGNAGAGGDGGDGAANGLPAERGGNGADSGGGGGGGAGVIRVLPAQTIGGSISPPPS
jgi:hypothetical protein